MNRETTSNRPAGAVTVEPANVVVLNHDSARDYPELSFYFEELGIEPSELFSNIDPDRAYVGGILILFSDIQIGNTTYVIFDSSSEEDAPQKLEKMLYRFFAFPLKNHFEPLPSSWDNLGNDCIAYRGGQGYTYSLYKYIA